MTNTFAYFQKKYHYLILGIIVCSFIVTKGSLSAKELNVTINAVDSHLSYLGGNHFIFLNIENPLGQTIKNLSIDNLTLRINQESKLIKNFNSNHTTSQKLVLLSGIETFSEPKDFNAIKNGFLEVIRHKKEHEKIVLKFNGFQQRIDISDQSENKLNSVIFNPDQTIPLASFLLENIDITPGIRQWILLIVSDSQPPSEYEIKQLETIFSNPQISLIPILVGNTVTNHWIKQLQSHQINKKIYEIKEFDQLPALVKNLKQTLDQEYLLSYRTNVLGTSPYNIAIKLISTEGTSEVKEYIQPKVIWEHHAFPLLWQSVLLGIFASVGIGLWMMIKQRPSKITNQIGFRIITVGEKPKLIPLDQKSYTLDFLTDVKFQKNLRLSANLGKVILTAEQGSYFLEDKNYKNALLINRRRVRRTSLRHGDVLDIGELTLIYLNSKAPAKIKEENIESMPINVHYDKPQGPLRKKIGVLVDEHTHQEYYLVKNITFIGRSKINNIVMDSQNIAPKHAKIVRIGNQYKLLSISLQEGSFVNRRRVEQRFLRDGDEISFDNCRFRFHIAHTIPLRIEKHKGQHLQNGK